LETLHQLLKEDDGLRELSQTPLMLSIMVMAYYGIPTNEIQTQKIENLDMRRRQLFDLYIEKVFERKGKKNPLYPKEKIIKWLSWLAAKMKASNQSIFYMSLLQPSWLNIKEIFIYFIISRFILCFFIVFLSIFTYSLFFYLANNTFPIYKVLFSSFIFGLLLCPPIIILDIIKFYKKHDSIYKSRKLLFLFYIVSYYIIFTILFYFGEQIKFMYYIIDYLDANYGITQKYTSYSIVRIVFISIIMVSIVGATRSIIRNNIIDIYLPEQIKFSMYKSISKSILISFFFGIPLFIMIDTYMMTTQASREISMTLLLVFTIMVFIFSISVMGFNQYINNSRTKFDSEIFYAIKSIGKIYIVGMLFGGIINPLLLPFFLSSRVFDDLIILKSLYLFVIPIAIVTSTYIMTVICMFQYGGFDIINYLLLRAIIRIKINMNFKVFNYASFLTLLNPVGSGYVFIHRYLLEHFATLYEEAEQAKQKK